MIRLLRVMIAVGLLLAGLAMLVLPGPGLLTIAASIAWLQRELPIVARWVQPLRRWLGAVGAALWVPRGAIVAAGAGQRPEAGL